jgi:hypothetical protein
MTTAATSKPTGRAAPVANFRWKKGVSGNPSGKPKGTVSLSAAVQRMLRKDPKLVDDIAKTIINAAIAGDLGAARLLFERLDGCKPNGFFAINVDQSDRRSVFTVNPQVLSEIADARRRYEEKNLCPP